MVTVEFLGLYRLAYKKESIEIEAQNIRELLKKLYQVDPVYTEKELRNSILLLNGKNIMDGKKFRTKLKAGDVVIIMNPASGG